MNPPLQVDLPPELREFVESAVVRTAWGEPANSVRHLVEEAQRRWTEKLT